MPAAGTMGIVGNSPKMAPYPSKTAIPAVAMTSRMRNSAEKKSAEGWAAWCRSIPFVALPFPFVGLPCDGLSVVFSRGRSSQWISCFFAPWCGADGTLQRSRASWQMRCRRSSESPPAVALWSICAARLSSLCRRSGSAPASCASRVIPQRASACCSSRDKAEM